MEFFLIYLLIMLDSMKETFNILVVVGGGSVFFGLILMPVIHEYVKTPEFKKWGKRYFWSYVIIVILATLIPTTKQFAVIIGGGAVWQAVTSDKGKEVAGKIGGALESKLYQYLNEEPEKQENK